MPQQATAMTGPDQDCDDDFAAAVRRLDALLGEVETPAESDAANAPDDTPAQDGAARKTTPDRTRPRPDPTPPAGEPVAPQTQAPLQSATAQYASPTGSDHPAPGQTDEAPGGGTVAGESNAPVAAIPEDSADPAAAIDPEPSLPPDPDPAPTPAPATTHALATGDRRERDGLSVDGDPTPHDLDAEIEALLAEQPIDPAVLQASEDIAARDAREAEENREALRQRAEAATAKLVAASAQTEDEDSVEAAIVAEINGLLSAADDETDAAATLEDEEGKTQNSGDPTIDQIDRMLSEESDDDELEGDYFSADLVASGGIDAPAAPLADEIPPAPAPATQVSTDTTPATDTKDAHAEPPQRFAFDWRRAVEAFCRHTHLCCWHLNWPARRFLSDEWRATLGYLALLQAGGALIIWLLLVIL